ncbi:LLM class flavin-dependent oxidoreductase [Jiangella mangrovi]|uniref:Alkanesulfonate monooxygenase SsuD/methylene tetrahydromethanopterin reductase-like flavin-dependent oxidoreductase (Luciferase family) n=1 Tax=Jiangella mangrovi TaxID=1524084 RepID=A0A7W9GSS5_9ACTN|nr:LLM class flavin-dependent oxidoreductase [Jiangella mangrovi]MBB5789390.1 alkanesulfonate monooxygenase SsuD/methylene tetrahydromethanopterin reductase-like flavin-dependent oxidoreductase (luciferase family) [Jiangella mangrovi]
MTTHPRRFGVLVLPDAGAPTLLGRFRRAEELGFDQLFLPDHIGNIFATEPPWLDGWTMTAAAALATERIRIGTLVANPILRPPAVLAKAALTVDQLSGGRLDLGIGAGIMESDHHATGTEPWTVKERVARFPEYVRVLDEVLRRDGGPYEFAGDWYTVRDLPTGPATVQRPRPPILVGGNAPTVLRVAAEQADVWNTNGRPNLGVDDNVALAADWSRQVDEFAERAGRDPATLRKSVLLWATTDALTGSATLEQLVDLYAPAGFTEFVLGWPETDAENETFERLATEVVPKLR